MRTTTLFMLSLTALYAAPAAAECAPRFTQATQTVNVNASDVGNSAVARENFDIRVGNDQTGSCSARLRFSSLIKKSTFFRTKTVHRRQRAIFSFRE